MTVAIWTVVLYNILIHQNDFFFKYRVYLQIQLFWSFYALKAVKFQLLSKMTTEEELYDSFFNFFYLIEFELGDNVM